MQLQGQVAVCKPLRRTLCKNHFTDYPTPPCHCCALFSNLCKVSFMAYPTSQWEVRDFFTYHPLYVRTTKADDRPPEIWGNPKPDGSRGDKVKLFCTPCLNDRVGQIIQVEESDHQAGRIPAMRTRKEIERYCQHLHFVVYRYLILINSNLYLHSVQPAKGSKIKRNTVDGKSYKHPNTTCIFVQPAVC